MLQSVALHFRGELRRFSCLIQGADIPRRNPERLDRRRSYQFWLPDTFGYSAQFPQILQHCGVSRFLTQKLSWSLVNKFPHHTFYWEGIDGSSVLSHFPPGDNYNMRGHVNELLKTVQNFKDKGRSNCSAFLFGYGDGGHGPREDMLGRLARLKDCDGMPKVKLSSSDAFFSNIESERPNRLCRWRGELYLELHNGTYTTWAKVKKYNRKCEILLQETELLCTIAWVQRSLKRSAVKTEYCYPKAELDAMWKLLLLNQFHDVLPGSSINMLGVANDTHSPDLQPYLVNTQSFSRREVIKLPLMDSTKPSPKRRKLSGSCERVEDNEVDETHVEVEIPAYCVKPLSECIVPVQSKSQVTISREDDLIVLANDKVKATLDSLGRVTSLFCYDAVKKRWSKEAIDCVHPANQFLLYDDVPLYWDAWDVMDYHLETRKPVVTPIQRLRVDDESNPTHVSLEVSLQISDKSYLQQKIILEAGSPLIRFDTEVTWHENRKLLKVEFPTTVHTTEAAYDIQSGFLCRPNHFNTSWDSARFEDRKLKLLSGPVLHLTEMAFNNYPDGPGFGGNIPRDGLLNNPAFRMNQLNNYAADLERDQRLYAMAMELRMGPTRGEPASLMGLQLGEPAPPGVDVGVSRDRGRDRDRDRDFRSRDDRDRGRDRDRRRNDSDRGRGGDWSQERESRGSRHRDRSPIKGYRNNFDSDSRGSTYDDEDEYNMGDDGERSSSSGSHGSDRHRSRGSDRQDDKGGDKWVSNQPSRTIILRGLNQEIDEKIIGAELMMLGLPVKDIRLIRRQSGVSRGFAFVEFHNVADAQRWMEHTQGSLLLLNMYRASMAYSVTRDRGSGGRDGGNLQRNDWVCVKCLGHNFKRRDFCYNCNLPRKESEKSAKSSDGQDEIGTNPCNKSEKSAKSSDGQDEIGTNPCNTLIFRGLDALTTEEGLVKGLTQAFRSVPLAPIKNVAVVRDDLNTSRGFGFVEFHSVSASTNVLDSLNKMDPPLEVDGKQLLINYAKNTFNTTMAYIQQQQAQNQYYDSSYYQGQYYDPTTGQYYDYSQYYAQQAGGAVSGTDSTVTTSRSENSTNSAAAAHQKVAETPAHDTVTVNGVEYPVYPPPDTSTYQYEETSGYYYDPLTQLYYDANSQYYYNSTTGGYMYWDAEKSTYLPAPTGEEGGRGDGQDKKDSKEEKKDKEKVKIAKKIAKDMEKWAKSMNAQKEALKEGVRRPAGAQPGLSIGSLRQESATADAGYAILQKAKEDTTMMPPPPPAVKSEKAPAASSAPGLVASYGGDSDSGGEEEDAVAPLDESKLVDWTKLACLLCKRQFQSKEILSKHTQVSELHKQNLESLMKTKSAAAAGKIEYRDRAKERRLKYGAPEPPAPRERRRPGDDPEPVMFEQPTKEGIGGENIGNKLLQKMGWSQGQGLGKANQGRTDPIEARRRNQMSGLGARGANIAADVGDSYRDALKKTMFARYNEAD
ncbi:RNA-binding protein 5 [Elysia marginata]|uniref:RNA-binding protein 5 n=1 Tax=Elysia marginata TaxID=1093978 RepID=A0AAV4GB51_9GAST|nr:RNA-binding protein 5 [Elysia marginata]